MLVLFSYWLLVPGVAHAYIDPATGSLALQTTVGVLLTALFVVKQYWRRIRAWVAASFGGKRDDGRA